MTTSADVNRATINMTHGHTGLKLSESEASKHSESAKKRLLQSRKLSLVVDLDQTIIHAAFDPTIGEWKSDPTNPNYDALQDVQSFKLKDENTNNTAETEYYIQKRAGKFMLLKEELVEKLTLAQDCPNFLRRSRKSTSSTSTLWRRVLMHVKLPQSLTLSINTLAIES